MLNHVDVGLPSGGHPMTPQNHQTTCYFVLNGNVMINHNIDGVVQRNCDFTCSPNVLDSFQGTKKTAFETKTKVN